MDLNRILHLSNYRHPGEIRWIHGKPKNVPEGYVSYLETYGKGSLCLGWEVLFPQDERSVWLNYDLEEYLRQWVGSVWTNDVYTEDDVASTRVFAMDDESNFLVLCQRHGPNVIYLPHRDQQPQIVGESFDSWVSFCSSKCHRPFFEVDCVARCRMQFATAANYNETRLVDAIHGLWPNEILEPLFGTNNHTGYDSWIVAFTSVGGYLQLWSGERMTSSADLPLGAISIAINYDLEHHQDLLNFAESVSDGKAKPVMHRGLADYCPHATLGNSDR